MGTFKDILEGITYAASVYLEVVDDINNKTKSEKGEILLTHNGLVVQKNLKSVARHRISS
jgi:hypothetical protein